MSNWVTGIYNVVRAPGRKKKKKQLRRIVLEKHYFQLSNFRRNNVHIDLNILAIKVVKYLKPKCMTCKNKYKYWGLKIDKQCFVI